MSGISAIDAQPIASVLREIPGPALPVTARYPEKEKPSASETALKAEIDEDAWATLYRDKSRPFPRPDTGRFAVKVINHFGDEVMKVFAV